MYVAAGVQGLPCRDVQAVSRRPESETLPRRAGANAQHFDSQSRWEHIGWRASRCCAPSMSAFAFEPAATSPERLSMRRTDYESRGFPPVNARQQSEMTQGRAGPRSAG